MMSLRSYVRQMKAEARRISVRLSELRELVGRARQRGPLDGAADADGGDETYDYYKTGGPLCDPTARPFWLDARPAYRKRSD